MLLFVYTTTRKRFVIFSCRYFKLSWNTTALSESNCRNLSCSSLTYSNIYLSRHVLWITSELMFASSCKVHPRLTFKQRGKKREGVNYSVLRWDKDKMVDWEKQQPLMIVLILLLEKREKWSSFFKSYGLFTWRWWIPVRWRNLRLVTPPSM